MDKRLGIVTAYVSTFEERDAKMLQYYIEEAIYRDQKVLPIIIDSYGGDVYTANSMIDSLKASGLDVITISKGKTMSAGALLFSIGSKRYAAENTTFMIHEASACVEGTATEIENASKHATKMSNKMLSMMAKNCGKPQKYFIDLIASNNGNDVFLDAEEALNHGLVTAIGAPTIAEIFPDLANSDMSEGEDEMEDDIDAKKCLSLLMSYSIPKHKTKNINSVEEKPTMDLKAVLAKLSVDEKKPVEALQSQLVTAEETQKTLKAELETKAEEVKTLKASYEQKLADIENANDKAFLETLKASGKLKPADFDQEIKILASLSVSPEAKTAYKAKLSAAASVVAGAIAINEQPISGNLGEKMKAYAKKHGLNLSNNADYLKVKTAVEGGQE